MALSSPSPRRCWRETAQRVAKGTVEQRVSLLHADTQHSKGAYPTNPAATMFYFSFSIFLFPSAVLLWRRSVKLGWAGRNTARRQLCLTVKGKPGTPSGTRSELFCLTDAFFFVCVGFVFIFFLFIFLFRFPVSHPPEHRGPISGGWTERGGEFRQ